MTEIIGIIGGLWSHVGPSIFFAALLPVSLIASGAVAIEGYRRYASKR